MPRLLPLLPALVVLAIPAPAAASSGGTAALVSGGTPAHRSPVLDTRLRHWFWNGKFHARLELVTRRVTLPDVRFRLSRYACRRWIPLRTSLRPSWRILPHPDANTATVQFGIVQDATQLDYYLARRPSPIRLVVSYRLSGQSSWYTLSPQPVALPPEH